LDIPQLNLSDQVAPFSAEEVARIVRESPADRAPGPVGFNGAFFKAAWEVVGLDVVRMFHALWEVDFRSFHSLNGAIMILSHKTEAHTRLRDYRPINLIHSIGKLFAKGLALRLAPRMSHIVKDNQSVFIQGRRIHENFCTVLLACRSS
jgi:hypothetical protein